MDEQNLIFIVVNDAGKLGAAANQVARGELALEHRVLEMIAVATHGLKNFAEAAVVGDVVADKVGLAHLMKV